MRSNMHVLLAHLTIHIKSRVYKEAETGFGHGVSKIYHSALLEK